MIREALQYLIGLGNTRTETIGEQIFSTQPIHVVKAATPAPVAVRSLSGLVEYLKSEFDGDTKLMVHVESPTEVLAFSTFNRDFARNKLIHATALLPEIRFGHFYDSENFNILLQSCFVPNPDRATMLQVVGNIKEEAVNTVGDDGISQAVVAKTGIATVATVTVPNPVLLAPFRTFVEVAQPESEFVFRMKSGPSCALFEADGGAWKLRAMELIKAYLDNELEKQIEAGKIVMIA